MERKLVQQGPATLMVSVPAKWIRRFNLNKGDTVDVSETEKGLLVIPSTRKHSVVKTEINLSILGTLANRFVRGLYVNGYDEVLIKFEDVKLLDDLHARQLPELLGFEVVEQTASSALIRDVSHPAPEEFDAMLRRVFLLIIMMNDALIEALEGKTYFDSVVALDQNVNRSVNFCLRLISKGHVSPSLTPHVLVQLEFIGDIIKSLAKKNVKKSNQEVFLCYSQFFRSLYELFFSFNIEKAVSVAKLFDRLSKKIESSDQSLKPLADSTIVILGLMLGRV